MKKLAILSTVLFIFCITFPAWSQAEVGGMIGLNFGEISEDPQEDGLELSFRTGILFGGVVMIKLPGVISLMFEPTYAQKGSSINAIVQDPFIGTIETEQKWKFTYLDVPVLARFAFGVGPAPKPYLIVGPSIGFLLSAKVAVENVSIDGVPQEILDADVDIKELFKSVDIGVNLGGGIDLPLGGGNSIFFEAMYNLGITNIAETPEGDDSSVKNRGLQIKGGILFPLAR